MARARPHPNSHGQSEVHGRPLVARAIEAEKLRLGARLRAIREAKGWSREVAAEAIGIHAVHVARVELGTANVTLATLVAMSRAYGVSLAEFFVQALRPATGR